MLHTDLIAPIPELLRRHAAARDHFKSCAVAAGTAMRLTQVSPRRAFQRKCFERHARLFAELAQGQAQIDV